MSTRMFAVVLLGLVAVTGVPPAASAQSSAGFQRLWYQAYDEGVRAALRGDWATAIQALEAAKRSGPAPGRRVLFQGDRIDVFNPDYYLGLAYNATKRFAEAEAAFTKVVDDKLIVKGDKQFDQLLKQVLLATGESYLVRGERAFQSGRFAEAETALSLARAAGLEQDPRVKNLQARLTAEDAKAASTNVVDVQQRLPVTTDVPPDPKVAANDPKAPVDKPVPPPSNATSAPVVNRPEVQTNPIEREKANVGLANPIRPTGPETVPAAPLNEDQVTLQGATAYFEGNYEEAVRVLTPAFRIDPPSNLVAFYLACSHAALQASGRASSSNLDEARRMFAYARGGASLQRHLRLISPRVLELLGVGAASAP